VGVHIVAITAIWSEMTNQEVFRFDFEQGEELLNELNNGEGISIELSRNMADEMNQLRRDPDGILLVGTEGTKTITIFLAPQHVVEGIGPVLIPTFDDQRIVAMVSKEFIEATAAKHNEAEDQDLAQIEWNLLLDNLFDATLELANNR
jgi:hypothetical protein